MKKTIDERIADAMKTARDGDPTFWRHPLAEATVSLLEAGVPVTLESLIAKLDVVGDSSSAVLKREASKAAIERLRQIVVQKD